MMCAHRCDGEYTIVFCNKKPSWLQDEFSALEPHPYARYAYLKMTGDKVAYAVQSARRIDAVVLQHNGKNACFANILQENYSHDADDLYIGFDEDNIETLSTVFKISACKCEKRILIKFELKHSYFQNLSSLVYRLSNADKMVGKIFPNRGSFRAAKAKVNLTSYKDLCSEDQFQALQAIASCSSRGPPVIVTGAFGTGKTRLLALAARYFLKHKTQGAPTRVLICTQQRVSASNFVSMYMKLEEMSNRATVIIVQGYGFKDHRFMSLYKRVDDFELYVDEHSSACNTMVVVTTCLTARSIARFISPGFFTHIFIDEGAQMREPEAIAPLLMANPERTKIVIAGDDQQVRF